MRRRVVVTGAGMINPLGNQVEAVWEALKAGKSGVGYTTIFDASQFPTKISSEIKNWNYTDAGLDPAVWAKRGRHTKFAAQAFSIRSKTHGVSASIWGAAKATRTS